MAGPSQALAAMNNDQSSEWASSTQGERPSVTSSAEEQDSQSGESLEFWLRLSGMVQQLSELCLRAGACFDAQKLRAGALGSGLQTLQADQVPNRMPGLLGLCHSCPMRVQETPKRSNALR